LEDVAREIDKNSSKNRGLGKMAKDSLAAERITEVAVGIDLISMVGLRRRSNYELRIMNFELKENS